MSLDTIVEKINSSKAPMDISESLLAKIGIIRVCFDYLRPNPHKKYTFPERPPVSQKDAAKAFEFFYQMDSVLEILETQKGSLGQDIVDDMKSVKKELDEVLRPTFDSTFLRSFDRNYEEYKKDRQEQEKKEAVRSGPPPPKLQI